MKSNAVAPAGIRRLQRVVDVVPLRFLALVGLESMSDVRLVRPW